MATQNMATPAPIPTLQETSENGSMQTLTDPFNDSEQRRASHRYSAFDTDLFSQFQPASSPSQAKRALEAHLSETDRRLEEASKLGTSLVQQRKDLSDKLKEVEKLQGESEIGPDLRKKLVEIEKEYNDLGRDSARAFLGPKSRQISAEEIGNNPTSPTKFSSQATDSPSKVQVPSRKQRNQPTNRVHDIEFATEISTSLLAQVRQLQAHLAEKDESLRAVTLAKSQLEEDAQGQTQRLKHLTDSEQHYRDENWNLETQKDELIDKVKEQASHEQKLQQQVAAITAEKSAAQRELDDSKSAHGKLLDDHTAFRKAHDVEFAGLRKNATLADTDRGSLQKKIDELTAQNQELAKAVAARARTTEEMPVGDIGPDPEGFSLDRSDMEHSPPPSPSKGPSRNSVLESETLKSSLQHAHRMIQTLKSNIHREKTEKLELKRMLQDSRDELEMRRSDGAGGNKRMKTKSQVDLNRRPSKFGQLGAGRNSRTDVELEDAEWEDHGDNVPKRFTSTDEGYKTSDASDAYQTANDTEDAFETADERHTGTESDAFQTGAESLAGESDELTETETGVAGTGTVRGKRIVSGTPANKRASYISTASSTEGEEDLEAKTPVQSTFSNLKYRLRLSRGSRRSRVDSEGPEGTPENAKDSPASFRSSAGHKGQTLAAELGDLGMSDEEEEGTPSKSIRPISAVSTPKYGLGTLVTMPPVSKIPMIDSGMMTDEYEPEAVQFLSTGPIPLTPRKTHDQGVQGTPIPSPTTASSAPYQSQDSATQDTPISFKPVEKEPAVNSAALLSHLPPSQELVSAGTKSADNLLAQAPQPQLDFSSIRSVHTAPTVEEQKERPSTAISNQANTEKPESNDNLKEAAGAGVIGSVLGWAMGKKLSEPQIAEDDASKDVENVENVPTEAETKKPFQELSTNVMQRGRESPVKPVAAHVPKADQSSQTTLSAEQIESMLSRNIRDSNKYAIAPISTAGPVPSSSKPVMPPKSQRRPGSSSSIRSSTVDMPPLPSDHQRVIAAAAQRSADKDKSEGSMGPPLLPASSYRSNGKRPMTPSEQVMGSPKSVVTPTTPRNRYSNVRSTRSRRSSVSSFESELDAKFNIRADGMPMPQGLDGGTDPRMIQAITQTMIGEYLWKYTRKAGRGEMSTNRHRRFFWVHPYTRTLYWSDQDPSTAGRVQLKAKSVAIEAIRVVTDDNPLPPGLHRKSLVIITPGRDVKFTATTGQRHETWFNALSYLLLRSGPEHQYSDNLTAEDVAEFNPQSAKYNRASTASHTSLSTYNSRTNTTRLSHLSSRNASPSKGSVRRVSATPHESTSSRYSSANQGSLGSRLSYYLRPGRASESPFASNAAQQRESSGIYDASVVNDSAEDVRQVLEKQEEEADRLENVRACCDGKHDVGSLSHRKSLGTRIGSHAH